MGSLRARPHKTIADYMALPDTVRAEFISGEIYVSPSPKYRHQRVVSNLHAALRRFVDDRGLGEVCLSPFDVHLPSGDIVQPDLVFVAAANRGIIRDWIRGAPDLLVQVISPDGAVRDRIVKRDLYARNGIREYWIVDPEDRTVEVLALATGGYAPHGWYRDTDHVGSIVLAGLELPVRDVMA